MLNKFDNYPQGVFPHGWKFGIGQDLYSASSEVVTWKTVDEYAMSNMFWIS